MNNNWTKWFPVRPRRFLLCFCGRTEFLVQVSWTSASFSLWQLFAGTKQRERIKDTFSPAKTFVPWNVTALPSSFTARWGLAAEASQLAW